MINVVIPYYNKSKYIERAVNSALRQFLVSTIIIIDDGSSKEERDFLRSKYENNEKIRIISQPNKGLFRARLRGLSCCSSPFMVFLDADDELDPTWSANLLPYIDLFHRQKNKPIVAYEMCCKYDDYTDYDCTEPHLCLYNKWSDVIKDNAHFDHSACNKLIPRSTYLQINHMVPKIQCQDKLNFAEDIVFMCLLMLVNDEFVYSSNYGYIYHKEAEGSILKSTPNVYPFMNYIKEIKQKFFLTHEIIKFIESEINLGGFLQWYDEKNS